MLEYLDEVLGDEVTDDLAEAGTLRLDRRRKGVRPPALPCPSVDGALDCGAVAPQRAVFAAAQVVGGDEAATVGGFLDDAARVRRQGQVEALRSLLGPCGAGFDVGCVVGEQGQKLPLEVSGRLVNDECDLDWTSPDVRRGLMSL
ncbi:hypothetical protein [Streptomyces sp. B1I3]|uniref:hypothetical protein n=1 Tax=Streptomyces sp. B1I3 TaxID=3042264 RepID=UPI00278958A9|nr:hypothetical protein [Streptomyces sp. B1I3]MDQ0791938.1 hypothetical protein [Streptomyces sp. B1I3]